MAAQLNNTLSNDFHNAARGNCSCPAALWLSRGAATGGSNNTQPIPGEAARYFPKAKTHNKAIIELAAPQNEKP